MRTEPRAQLHKPVKKNFLLILGVHLHPVHPPAYATVTACRGTLLSDNCCVD